MAEIKETERKQTWRTWQRFAAMIVFTVGLPLIASAIESGVYRILSVSDSIKLILISEPVSKEMAAAPKRATPAAGKSAASTVKYVLDASAAKITVNGKPAEFKDLKYYASAQVKFQLHKDSKEGIPIDGKATEIKIIIPPDAKQQH